MSSVRNKENVWDYPRPPAMEKTSRHLRVVWGSGLDELVLVDTTQAYRILETSHPPTYYVPPTDIKMEFLRQNARSTFCEVRFKTMHDAYGFRH